MSEPLGIFSPSGTYGNDWPANPVLSQGLHGSLSDAGGPRAMKAYLNRPS